MTKGQTIRLQLRSATADHHDRVDRLFGGLDLADHRSYGLFLTAQAEAHLATEAALTAADAGSILPDWSRRQRAALLLADLAAMDLSPPAAIAPPVFAGAAAVLGAVYVLEGSRLGGQVLRRSVPADMPTGFLGAADPGGWRRLLALIEERVIDEADRHAAIAAAQDVFTLFEHSGRRHLTA